MRLAVCLLAVGCVLGFAPRGWSADAPADTTAAPPALDYASMDKLGWKLSCQCWTFREKTLFDTIDTLKKLGIRYIEMFPGQRLSKDIPAGFDQNLSSENVDMVLQKLKDAGITAMNFGVTGIPGNERDARKLFDFAKKMGLKTIVSEPGEDQFAMIDKLCQEYNINVAIHDHPKPSHYWNPDTVLKVCAARSNHIGSCADTGHWYRSGLVPIDCLKKLKGRIISLHFKDLSLQKQDVPWGTGVCDARGMLDELKSQGFPFVFSIEYESTSGDVLYNNVEKCVQWFSTQATELAAQ